MSGTKSIDLGRSIICINTNSRCFWMWNENIEICKNIQMLCNNTLVLLLFLFLSNAFVLENSRPPLSAFFVRRFVWESLAMAYSLHLLFLLRVFFSHFFCISRSRRALMIQDYAIRLLESKRQESNGSLSLSVSFSLSNFTSPPLRAHLCVIAIRWKKGGRR